MEGGHEVIGGYVSLIPFLIVILLLMISWAYLPRIIDTVASLMPVHEPDCTGKSLDDCCNKGCGCYQNGTSINWNESSKKWAHFPGYHPCY